MAGYDYLGLIRCMIIIFLCQLKGIITQELGLLQRVGPITVSSSKENILMTVLLPKVPNITDFNTVLTEISSSLEVMSQATPYLAATSPFKDTLRPPLTNLKADVGQIRELITTLSTYKNDQNDHRPQYPCHVNLEEINVDTLIEAKNEIKGIVDILDLASPIADYIANKSKVLALVNAMNSIKDTLGFLLETLQTRHTILESLTSNELVDSLAKSLSTQDCFGVNNFEKIKLLACLQHKKGISCDLDITTYGAPQTYEHFLAVNYQGVQLSARSVNQIIVKTTGNLWGTLDCDSEPEEDDSNYNIFDHCMFTLYQNPCSYCMLGNDFKSIISNCNFSLVEPEMATRIENGGLLIMGEELTLRTVKSDTKAVQKYLPNRLPVLVYSQHTISIDNHGVESLFKPTTDNVVEREHYGWLTQDNINKMYASAQWLALKENIDSEDMIDYILIGLSFLTVPAAIITFLGFCTEKFSFKECCPKKTKDRRITAARAKQNYNTNKRVIANQY